MLSCHGDAWMHAAMSFRFSAASRTFVSPCVEGTVTRDGQAPCSVRGVDLDGHQLPVPLEQAVVSLKVGSVSNVVKSTYGYHLFKLEQRVEPLPFEKIRQEVIERLQSEKKRQLIEAFGERLAAAAVIVIHRDRLGFAYRGRYGSP